MGEEEKEGEETEQQEEEEEEEEEEKDEEEEKEEEGEEETWDQALKLWALSTRVLILSTRTAPPSIARRSPAKAP